MTYGFSNVAWFVHIERAWRAFANRAKAAMPCANVAAQHERRRAIRPALENVWALCFLTNRVQVQALDQLQQMILIRRIAQTNPQPIRFRLTRFGIEYSKF